MTRREQARAARREIEEALDANASPAQGWRWLPQISCWLDALLVLEETS